MKKILSLLSAVVLTSTASTSIISCDGEETPKPNPEPIAKIDISNKITSSIDLGQLDANTKADFLAKLQEKLILMSNLTTITINDYDIYKTGTTTAIQDSDITRGTSLNIKIVAKGNNFEGTKNNISTNYTQKDTRTDLKDLKWYWSVKNVVLHNLADFINKIINEINESQEKYKFLSKDDVNILSIDGITPLTNEYIVKNNRLGIVVIAKNESKNFYGSKTLQVNLSVDKEDLKNLPGNVTINDVSNNDVDDFTWKLIKNLRQNAYFYKLSKDDVNILKGDGKPLVSNDIVKNDHLTILVIAKTESKNFYGSKTLQVKLIIKENKQDLQNYIQDELFNSLHFTFNTNENYEQLNEQIINQWKHINKLASGYEIKYYDGNNEEIEITKNKQTTDSFYFVIYASKDDPNWEGKTKWFEYATKDLQHYTQVELFNDLHFTFNKNESYEQLNEQIINQWIHINKLASGYEIKYYDGNNEEIEITKNKQTTDSFYFVIYASKDDPNWTGNTNLFYYTTEDL